MLLLALSCLQGRPQQGAFDELVALVREGFADGIQLTPGNQPCPGFRAHVIASGVPIRFHHAFTWNRQRRSIYAPDGSLAAAPSFADGPSTNPTSAVIPWSVHPPMLGPMSGPMSTRMNVVAAGSDMGASVGTSEGQSVDIAAWRETIGREIEAKNLLIEVMTPGQPLGSGREIHDAIERGWRLAVDVSHVFQQQSQGVLDRVTTERLFAFDRVGEVHVSGSDGRHDLHRPLVSSDFGLGWARAKMASGTCAVLECYMHRLSWDERRAQLDLVRT